MEKQTLRVMWFVPAPVAVVAASLGLPQTDAIEAVRNQSSDEQFEALAAGRIDAVVTAMDNVIAWNRRPGPQDLRILAQVESTTPLTVIGRAGHERLESLRGTDILVDAPDNGFVIALRALLAEAGLAMGDYRFVPQGGVKERFDALMAGKGSATLLGPPFDVMAVQAGLVKIASVQQRYPAFPGQGLVMSARRAQELRPLVSTWLSSLQLACERMAADAVMARAALQAEGFPPPAVEALLACAPASLRPDHAGISILIGHRRELGLPGGNDTVALLVDDSFLGAAT